MRRSNATFKVRAPRAKRRPAWIRAAGLALAIPALALAADDTSTRDKLEETRMTMDKWIETQQIISKETKEWQQGKEILAGRLDVVKREIGALSGKLDEARSGIAESDKKKKELLAEQEQLKAAGERLSGAIAGMEGEVRKLFKQIPEPLQAKLQPLYQRIPEDPAATRVSTAERFQNVLGILNELNKANSEITVNYEVHTLASGKPTEVKAIYVGLAQAYYLSAKGEAGIGRPGPNGWVWEPAPSASRDITLALEILESKHAPAFVPLPVKIQ